MFKKSLMAITLLASLSLPAIAEISAIKGYQAYEKEDYVLALRNFRPLAKNGNHYAQYTLGVMHAMGQGVKRNDKKAFEFYMLSAEQGFDDAQFALGKMYKHARGVPRDYNLAARWFKKAANQGHGKAKTALQELCEYRKWICEG